MKVLNSVGPSINPSGILPVSGLQPDFVSLITTFWAWLFSQFSVHLTAHPVHTSIDSCPICNLYGISLGAVMCVAVTFFYDNECLWYSSFSSFKPGICSKTAHFVYHNFGVTFNKMVFLVRNFTMLKIFKACICLLSLHLINKEMHSPDLP